MCSRFNSCIIQKILDIADTRNVTTSKNPLVVCVISCNLRVPSTPQIQNILISARSRRQSSRTIPSRPGRCIGRILQRTVPMLRCIINFQSKATRRVESKIRKRIGDVHVVRRVDLRCSCKGATSGGEHVGKSISCCCRTGSGRRYTISDRIFSSLSCRELEASTTFEHAIIAMKHQRSSRQNRSLSKTGATLEHALIAILCQRSSRQCRSLSEAGATLEHTPITILCQRSRGQSRSLYETGAILEHLPVTTDSQRHSR